MGKYNESKKIKKAFAVLCNLCSSEHKPTQTAVGGCCVGNQHKVVLQSISLAEPFSSLGWNVLRFCVWASLIRMEKDKKVNRLNFADTGFLLCSCF